MLAEETKLTMIHLGQTDLFKPLLVETLFGKKVIKITMFLLDMHKLPINQEEKQPQSRSSLGSIQNIVEQR
jgi:hypothetical protein